MEVAESRALKSLVQEKEDLIASLQNDCSRSRLALTHTTFMYEVCW